MKQKIKTVLIFKKNISTIFIVFIKKLLFSKKALELFLN
jgi:hypothetical protein